MIFYLNVVSVVLAIVVLASSTSLFLKKKSTGMLLISLYCLLFTLGQVRWISYFSISLSTFDDYYWSFVEYLTLFIFIRQTVLGYQNGKN